jgi:hypothetical protein
MEWCSISAVSSGGFGARRRESRIMFPTVAKPYLLLLRMDTPCLYSEATVAFLFQGFVTGQWPSTFENRPILRVCAGLLVRTMLQSLRLQRDHYPLLGHRRGGRDRERCIYRLSSPGIQAVHPCFLSTRSKFVLQIIFNRLKNFV